MKQRQSTAEKTWLTRPRQLLLLLFGVGALAAAGCEGGAGKRPSAAHATAPGAELSAREVVARGGVLLDVRTPGEFASGHLDGALNIPVDELERRIGELPSDKAIVVYCRSGRRSAIAADYLSGLGRTVLDIGSMGNW